MFLWIIKEGKNPKTLLWHMLFKARFLTISKETISPKLCDTNSLIRHFTCQLACGVQARPLLLSILKSVSMIDLEIPTNAPAVGRHWADGLAHGWGRTADGGLRAVYLLWAHNFIHTYSFPNFKTGMNVSKVIALKILLTPYKMLVFALMHLALFFLGTEGFLLFFLWGGLALS